MIARWLHIGPLGPLAIRVGSKGIAGWGYARVQIGGLYFWTRDTGGRLHLVGYHPRACPTWHWFVALYKSGGKPGRFNLQWRRGYGERGLCMFGWSLSVTEQAYHKERP